MVLNLLRIVFNGTKSVHLRFLCKFCENENPHKYKRSGKFPDGRFSVSGNEICKGESSSSVNHGFN